MSRMVLLASTLLFASCLALAGEESAPVDSALTEVRADIDKARESLVRTRGKITGERSKLSTAVTELEVEVADLRRRWRREERIADAADSALRDLRDKEHRLRTELDAVRQTLVEARRNTQTHFSLLDEQAFAGRLEEVDARLDEETSLPEAAPIALALLSGHVRELARVRSQPGNAIDPEGRQRAGTFMQIGGVGAAFATDAGDPLAGLVRREAGSAEPHLHPCRLQEESEAIRSLFSGQEAAIPLDLTGGAALKSQSAERSLADEIRAGGPVMVPILALAVLGLLVAIWKAIQLYRTPSVSGEDVRTFIDILAEDQGKAIDQAGSWRGPAGRLLAQAANHAGRPREQVEEILHETILAEMPDLESRLSLLSVGAAVAPLLGLLGTVTGMIHTFRLISIFGTGDARMLSGGISEALVTTEAGLVVAIPLLLCHALLSRRVRAIADGLEQAALAILNENNRFATPEDAVHE